MPNTRSPQTLFVFKAEYQSAWSLSESLFSRPIESHSGLEQNYFILGRTERDRCTDGPSQIWILKTVVIVFFSPAHPWVISPSTSWNVISLGSGWVFCCPLPSGWGWYWKAAIWGCGWTGKQETWEKEGWVVYLGGEIEARKPGQTWQESVWLSTPRGRWVWTVYTSRDVWMLVH